MSQGITFNECFKYETTYLSEDMAYNIGIENSAEECQRHCQNTTGCNHFSYEKEPRRCRLKTTSDEYDVQYSKDTIAGPKYCGEYSSKKHYISNNIFNIKYDNSMIVVIQ